MSIAPWPGNPNYGVTRDGRVFRIVRSHDHGRRVPFELKQRPDKDGYLIVGGWNSPLPTLRVHRMVAETFIPNPDGLPLVAHDDGSTTNNVVENLRWDTPKGNHADKPRHGTLLEGEQTPTSKLTDDMVREARSRAAAGETHTSIAEDMPVCRSVLSRAIRRETWDHV